jgi:phage repressor protein C with HTH and peptisase S24 domain
MAKQDYARVIREARKNAGLSQEGLAARLGVSRNAVAGWETGHSRPNLDLIADLCHALQISTDHFFGRPASPAAQSRKALNLFASLEPDDRQVILWQMQALAEHRREQLLEDVRHQLIPLYRNELGAAAGFGAPLGDSSGEMIYLLRDPLTEQADEVITVSGRSMEPTFHDGDLVLVQHTGELRPGDLGIFLVDNEGFIKEYRKDGLHSHNPAYPVMTFNENQNVRCIGKVLGQVSPEQLPSSRQLQLMEEVSRTKRI